VAQPLDSTVPPPARPQIGTWTPKSSSTRGGGGAPPVSYRRAWGISVKRDDDAYVWARWLAPVYSVTVANVKAALRMQVGMGVATGGRGYRAAGQSARGQGGALASH
jgi:hypothetical protein